jgi:hypothetical protein
VNAHPSRGFAASLFGLGMTVLSWYGPWAWPSFPARVVIDLAFGSQTEFSELPTVARGIAVVVLIAINSGAWALIPLAIMGLRHARTRRRTLA